jgi:hypothetical protein
LSGLICKIPFPDPCWIFSHPVGVKKTIHRFALADQFGTVTHALKAEFPDDFDRWSFLAHPIRMKRTLMECWIIAITGLDFFLLSSRAVKAIGSDRFSG